MATPTVEKPKRKPHSDPGCACDGCSAFNVPRDPTSGIYMPQTQEQWEQVFHDAGIPTADVKWYELQEVDTTQMSTDELLTKFGELGWAAKDD